MLKGKNIGLLYNQVTLDVEENFEDQSLRLRAFDWISDIFSSLFSIDGLAASQSLRQVTHEASHYKEIPIAPGMFSETVMYVKNTKFDK